MSVKHTFSAVRKDLHQVLRDPHLVADGMAFCWLVRRTDKQHRHWLVPSRQQCRRIRQLAANEKRHQLRMDLAVSQVRRLFPSAFCVGGWDDRYPWSAHGNRFCVVSGHSTQTHELQIGETCLTRVEAWESAAANLSQQSTN